MRPFSERGQSLIEVTVAVAIVAIVAGALLGAGIAAMHRFGPDPVQAALERTADRELRIAADLEKYQGPTLAPSAIATSMPLPSSSPIPIGLALATTELPSNALTIAVTASTQDPPRTVTLTTTLTSRAPAPGSVIVAPMSVAQPTGAP